MVGVPIGIVSKKTGLKIPTIRYYEEIGLTPALVRTQSGRRMYGKADISRLSFIKHARELGFEIADIRTLLQLADFPDRPCEDADAIARGHLAEIDIKINRLAALRKELATMIKACPGDTVHRCRVIETIADHKLCLHAGHG